MIDLPYIRAAVPPMMMLNGMPIALESENRTSVVGLKRLCNRAPSLCRKINGRKYIVYPAQFFPVRISFVRD